MRMSSADKVELATDEPTQDLIRAVLKELGKTAEEFKTGNEKEPVKLPSHDNATPVQDANLHVRVFTLGKEIQMTKFVPFRIGPNVILMRQSTSDLLNGLYDWVRAFYGASVTEQDEDKDVVGAGKSGTVTEEEQHKKLGKADDVIPRNVVLTGTAGMGKSVLVWLLTQLLVHEGYCVVYCTKDVNREGEGHAYIIRSGEKDIVVQYVVKPSLLRLLTKEDVGERVVQIRDGQGATGMPEIAFGCILSVSSVRDKVFREEVKNCDNLYFLPAFSEEETIVFATVISQYLGEPKEDTIMNRFNQVGGCPRFLLGSKKQYARTLKKQRAAVKVLCDSTHRAKDLQTLQGEPPSGYLVHCGACPSEESDLNPFLQKYSIESELIASALASKLLALHRGVQVGLIAEALTGIDTPARPFAFELVVVHFVQEGFQLKTRDGEITIPETHASEGSIDSAVKGEFLFSFFYVPLEKHFPTVDGWSIHCVVQVTRAKRHILDWTNETVISLFENIKTARKNEKISGNIPFLFIVPENRTCVPVERGTPIEGVDVYIVALSDLPNPVQAAYDNEFNGLEKVENIRQNVKTITVRNDSGGTDVDRHVVTVTWKEVITSHRYPTRARTKGAKEEDDDEMPPLETPEGEAKKRGEGNKHKGGKRKRKGKGK